MIRLSVFFSVFFFLLFAGNAFAQTATTKDVELDDNVASELSETGSSAPKLMDGVELEAVETYINPKQSQLGVGVGLYPFDSYFYGLSISAGYTFRTSRTFAWEILHASYFISFQKDLTTELADRFNVAPRAIDTLDFIVSSDVQYVFSYGKVAIMEEYIRYFRLSGIAGGALVKRSNETEIGLLMGLKFEAFTKDSFSWTFEIRDQLAIPSLNNYMTFVLGTGISF